MKVWCVPAKFPDPDEQPEQAEAAVKFLSTLKGLHGLSMSENGVMIISFTEKSNALSAKWKLEEFADAPLPIIEGVVSADGKKLDLKKVTERNHEQ